MSGKFYVKQKQMIERAELKNLSHSLDGKLPKFSIITPVLNGEKYLAETINSIRSQSFDSYEHIIVDGGSSDQTLTIANEAASQDSRLQVLERPGLGQYAAIVEGFGHACGDWLSWLNADDLYTSWALEVVFGFAKRREDADWVSGFPACWDADGTLRFLRPEGWHPQILIKGGWFHSQLLGYIQQESVFFKRSLFEGLSTSEKAMFQNANLAGDFKLWKSFAAQTKLVTVPTVLGGFRRHANNRSIVGEEKYIQEIRTAGAKFLPQPLANLARAIYLRATSTRAAQLAHEEDRADQ
ncbi:glycosyltransferase [Hyphococcus lacteus]|uniref:Glycosyltransferase n=1 Tax=Hyphococcus lacteus TaxID=3143536 RepID=A0ABV3Z133_9PROT